MRCSAQCREGYLNQCYRGLHIRPVGYICVTGRVRQACVFMCDSGVNKHIVGEVTEAKVKQRLQSIPPGWMCACVCV